MARPSIEAVTAANLADFAAFLHRHLNPAMSPAQWQERLCPAWAGAQAGNHGFLLRDGGDVVGGIGAIYAEREIAGRTMRTCNITSWCVLDSHRQQSMRLAMTVVNQPGELHFTDFSPTKVVGGTLRFFKFQPLDPRQRLLLNLPEAPWRAGRVLDQREGMRGALHGADRQALDDHLAFPWLRHLVIGDDAGWCHLIYKPRRYKRLPCAELLHVGQPAVLARHWGLLRGAMARRGFMFTQLEERWVQNAPRLSVLRTGFNEKLFLSPTLQAGQIDYLYSETMAMDL